MISLDDAKKYREAIGRPEVRADNNAFLMALPLEVRQEVHDLIIQRMYPALEMLHSIDPHTEAV